MEIWVVLHALQTIWSILTVLGGDVAGHTWYAACLLLGALQDNLDAIALCFLCHCLGLYLFVQETFLLSTTKSSLKTDLVDEAETSAGNLQGYETILLGDVELLISDVRQEATLGPPLRMGNVVAILIVDARYLTNFRHFCLILEIHFKTRRKLSTFFPYSQVP